MKLSLNCVLQFASAILFIYSNLATAEQANTHPRTDAYPLYRGLQPDEFMTRWLVCGPFPAAETEGQEVDEPRLRAAFAKDFLSDHGGETNILPTVETSHRFGQQLLRWRAIASTNLSVD